MKYIKKYENYEYAFSEGDLVKLLDIEEDKIYKIEDKGTEYAWIKNIDDSEIGDWIPIEKIRHLTREEFEEYKFTQDTKKYNL